MLAEFPVRRPIVACVISILIVLMGVVAYPTLPAAQYPDITPPVIQVTANYPGASAQVVADYFLDIGGIDVHGDGEDEVLILGLGCRDIFLRGADR